MVKEIVLHVPRYVKKFVVSEPDYTLADGVLFVPKISELGRYIHGISRTISYTQLIDKGRQLRTGHDVLRIRYNCKKKSYDVPVEKLTELEALLIENFRSSLVREVSAIHFEHPDENYGWMVRSFLKRRAIVVDDEQDKDVDYDTMKKIYRDHLQRIQQKNYQNRQLSQPVLSGL